MNISEINGDIENNSSKTIKLFRNAYPVCVYHEFFGYIAEKEEKSFDRGHVLTLAVLYAWVETIAKRFAEQEVRSRRRQKQYANILGGNI